MRRMITAITASGVLVAGAAIAGVVGPGLASAQNATEESATEDGARHPRAGARILDQALENLVGEDVLSEAQADSVREEVREVAEQFRDEHKGRHRFRALLHGGIDVSAQTIGITEEELIDEFRAGKSIAEVATENGVEPQTVTDALVAAGQAKLDELLGNDEITQEQYDEASTRLPELAERFVNHVRDGERPGRPGPRRGPGFGPGPDGVGSDAPGVDAEVEASVTA